MKKKERGNKQQQFINNNTTTKLGFVYVNLWPIAYLVVVKKIVHAVVPLFLFVWTNRLRTIKKTLFLYVYIYILMSYSWQQSTSLNNCSPDTYQMLAPPGQPHLPSVALEWKKKEDINVLFLYKEYSIITCWSLTQKAGSCLHFKIFYNRHTHTHTHTHTRLNSLFNIL